MGRWRISLFTAERLDGGAGWDILHAELVPEFFGVIGDNQMEIQPRTKNNQEIKFEAMDVGGTCSYWFDGEDANGLGGFAFFLSTITVDAKNMYDVVKIGPYYSDDDLVAGEESEFTLSGLLAHPNWLKPTSPWSVSSPSPLLSVLKKSPWTSVLQIPTQKSSP